MKNQTREPSQQIETQLSRVNTEAIVESPANQSRVSDRGLSRTEESPNTRPDEGGAQEAFDQPESIVTQLKELLGNDVVLLPVNHRQKAPAVSRWQNKTIADMEDAAYVRRLETGNIGVLLGKPSGNLCAIDIDDDAQVEPFLALNPCFRETFRSRGARGQQVWVRIEGEYPKLSKLVTESGNPWGEWRADGGQSVIYGVHPSGVDYQIVQEENPINISFDDIVWPEDLQLPWCEEPADELTASVGPAFEVTDRGGLKLNQMFWVQRYMAEHTIIFDSSLGDFFEYEVASGLWKRQTAEAIKRSLISDLQATALTEEINALHFKLTDALAESLVSLLRTMTEQYDVFSKRPDAIHVKNGMLVFEGDELHLKSFHPSYYSRNVCPYEFDESATCPRFLEELLGSALLEDDIHLMQKWAGACLLGRNRAQRLLLMLGTPGGGKSTFMDILERVIGIQNVVQLRTDHLSNRFELYGYVGKTLLTGKDAPADFLLNKNAHVIKALVGQDTLSAEKKGYCELVPLKGDFNMGITCNADLNVRLEGDSGAWRRRLMIVRYERPAPARKIPDFADRLLAEEGSGILRWMVEGAIRLLNDLDRLGDYELAQRQIERVDGLLSQSDSIRHFVEQCVIRDPYSQVTGRELKNAYLDYCEASGWIPMPNSELARQLPMAMLETHRTRSRNDIARGNGEQRGFSGVRIQLEGNVNV